MILQENVYKALRRDMLGGAFGRRAFLSENMIARRYDVGKAPVREALRRLCGEGLLKSYPRKGFLLSPPSRDDVRAALRLRAACECELADDMLSAPENDRALIARAAPPMTAAANAAFHNALAALCPSPAACDALYRLNTTIEHAQSLRPDSLNHAHEAVARALSSGDAATLRDALLNDATLESSEF